MPVSKKKPTTLSSEDSTPQASSRSSPLNGERG
jgi:hypothetical protein